jgi:hypothetical protein
MSFDIDAAAAARLEVYDANGKHVSGFETRWVYCHMTRTMAAHVKSQALANAIALLEAGDVPDKSQSLDATIRMWANSTEAG